MLGDRDTNTAYVLDYISNLTLLFLTLVLLMKLNYLQKSKEESAKVVINTKTLNDSLNESLIAINCSYLIKKKKY